MNTHKRTNTATSTGEGPQKKKGKGRKKKKKEAIAETTQLGQASVPHEPVAHVFPPPATTQVSNYLIHWLCMHKLGLTIRTYRRSSPGFIL